MPRLKPQWIKSGLNLWTIDYATTTMVAGTNYYSIDFPAIYLILCPPLSKNKKKCKKKEIPAVLPDFIYVIYRTSPVCLLFATKQ